MTNNIEVLTNTIVSVARCGLYICAGLPAKDQQLTTRTLDHLSAYRTILTRQLDDAVRQARSAGYKVWFRINRAGDTIKAVGEFGQAYNYWFSQSNRDSLIIRPVIEEPEEGSV